MRSTSSKQAVRECPYYCLYRLGCRCSGHLRIRINAVDAVSVSYLSGRGSHFANDPLRAVLYRLYLPSFTPFPYLCCVRFGIALCVVSILVTFVGPRRCTLLSRILRNVSEFPIR